VSNYTKTTNFTAKDSLSTGNPLKIVRGSEHDTEYNNISTAIGTKADTASPALTGTATAVNLTVSGALVVGADTVTTNTATQTLTNKTLTSPTINGGAISATTLSTSSATITGGTVTGITDLAVADGGTGASSATDARTNLGLGTIATQAASAVAVTGGAIDGTTVGTTTRSTVKATTLDLGLSTQSVAIGQGNASIMKNRIINGAMAIDQRNAGASLNLSATGQYTIDRWQAWEDTDGTMTAQQSSVAPAGFTNSLLFTTGTADSSLAAGQFCATQQRIEGFNVADLGFGTANAQTFTLSFWVRSSLTGTFGGSFKNSASTRSYPFTYSISVANTWEQKSVTVAGDTSGTWLTTNGIGLTVTFGLGVSSTQSGTAGSWQSSDFLSATGAVSVIGTAGATFYITGVQLEVGSSATGFEYVNYQTSLANCQRYYYKFLNNNGVGTGWYGQATTSLSTTRSIGSPITLPVPARTTPSVSFSNLNLVNVQGITTYAVTVANIYSGYSLYGTSFALDLTTSGITAGTVYFFYIADGGSVAYSMEL